MSLLSFGFTKTPCDPIVKSSSGGKNSANVPAPNMQRPLETEHAEGAGVKRKEPAPQLPAATVASKSNSVAASSSAKPQKKTKKASAKDQAASMYTKLKAVALDADYNDQYLVFSRLRDGRDLLLANEIWELPRTDDPRTVRKATKLKGRGATVWEKDIVPLPGCDALASITCFLPTKPHPTAGAGAVLVLYSLPDHKELCALSVSATAGALTGFKLSAVETGAGSATILISGHWGGSMLALIDAQVSLNAAAPRTGELTARQRNSLVAPQGGKMGPCKLFKDPKGDIYAAVACGGSIHILAVNSTGSSSASSSEAKVSPSGPVRSVHMHFPMKKRDEEVLYDMDLWHRPDGSTWIVSVGGDGKVATAALDDGKELLRSPTASFAQESWYGASSGTGPSKQYRYAACTGVSVCSKYGVAMVVNTREQKTHFYDLASPNSSGNGKRLGCSPSFGRCTIFCSAASPNGLFAISNSNSGDKATLIMLSPAGK